MDTNRPKVQIARWTGAALLFCAGLYSLNLSLFHFWAGTGPPSVRPSWHVAWGYRFFWTSTALILGSVFVAWALRKRAG